MTFIVLDPDLSLLYDSRRAGLKRRHRLKLSRSILKSFNIRSSDMILVFVGLYVQSPVWRSFGEDLADVTTHATKKPDTGLKTYTSCTQKQSFVPDNWREIPGPKDLYVVP